MSAPITSPSAIHKVLALAKKTFARMRLADGRQKSILTNEEFSSHLSELSTLMKTLTFKDLGLDKSPTATTSLSSTDNARTTNCKAPVTYIGLCEDADLSVGIFIISPRARLPLHDHPNMHGCLKVMLGNIEVSHFDRVALKDLNIPLDLPEPLQSRIDLIEREIVIPTESPSVLCAGPESDTVMLYPDKHNYHEIRPLGNKPAAFLDILSPPYNHGDANILRGSSGDYESRECTFYKRLVFRDGVYPGNRGFSWLQKLPCEPEDYYCDTEPYLGPPVNQP